MVIKGKQVKFVLTNVRYAPAMVANVFSSSIIDNSGYKLTQEGGRCLVCKNGRVFMEGRKVGSMFKLQLNVETNKDVCATVGGNEEEFRELKLWHERLAHASVSTMRILIKQGLLKDFNEQLLKNFFCEASEYGKSSRPRFSTSDKKATLPGELIHIDLCGPMEVQSFGGAYYFLLIKDDYSSYRNVFFLRCKSMAIDSITKFINFVQNKFSHKISYVKSDRGGEFLNTKLSKLYEENLIEQLLTGPYSPEQNGQIEREMRTVVESARSMLYASNLDKDMWAEAVNYAVQSSNCQRSREDTI